MLEGINFSYDGIKSVDMGLLNVQINGGMFEEAFLPSRKIEEKSINGKDTPYFQRISYSPLEFDLSFAFEYSYDERLIREVARWLNQDFYKEFYTIDNPSRIFYCMIDGDTKLIHNGLKQGYLTLKMRCNSPYSYVPEYNQNNMIYGNTKIVKSFTENTFNSEMGSQTDISINTDNNMEISNSNVKWSMLIGKKWSDL